MRLLAVAIVSIALWVVIAFSARTAWFAVKSDGQLALVRKPRGR
jgi:hypothetical protein